MTPTVYTPTTPDPGARVDGALKPESLDGDAPCIMLVDDEPVVSEVLRLYLEDDGYHEFEITSDSTTAVARAAERQPDLLLLDLMMPEVNGFEVLEALRAGETTRHLPVVVLTSATDPESKLRALELGATDFLAKPVDPSELVLRVRNILSMKAYQDRLEFFDGTTDLPNRRRFLDLLSRGLGRSRERGEHCAVMQLSMDRFKPINDAMGYGVGDRVLKEVGARLRKGLVPIVAALDGATKATASVARTGGDEFSVLLPAPSKDDAVTMAEALHSALSEPMSVGGEPVFLSASAGIAVSPAHGGDVDTLLANAGQAQSFVKRRGGGRLEVYSQDVETWARSRLSLERDLRGAVERFGLRIEYQPKVDVASGRIAGAEALLRWDHPDRGAVGPAEFIPLAEETGLIVPIGAWVMREACRQAAEWCRDGRGDLLVAVNVSPRQFQESGFEELVRDALRTSGLRPECLIIEVTEGLLMKDPGRAVSTLQALSAVGVKVSVDDFGTGYSSLAYLKMFKVHELKIDQSFLREIPDSENDAGIVNAIIAMARSLGLEVVAEGVETEAQLEFLASAGCDRYQGFLFSRSVVAEEFWSLASLEDAQYLEMRSRAMSS